MLSINSAAHPPAASVIPRITEKNFSQNTPGNPTAPFIPNSEAEP